MTSEERARLEEEKRNLISNLDQNSHNSNSLFNQLNQGEASRRRISEIDKLLNPPIENTTPPSAETIKQFIANNIAPPQIPQAIKDYASGTATAMPNYQTLKDIASGVTDLGTPTTGNIDFSNLANISDVANQFGLTDVAQGKYVNPETNPMFKTLFAKALEESLPVLNNSMQASGRAGSGTQKLLEGKLLADLSANIYNPERQLQTVIQQYLTGQDINQGQFKTTTGENARQFNTGLTENARQFNKGIQMNALNAIPTYQSMEDNDKIRRLNMLSQIAGTEQNYNQSVLDLPYNVQKRYNELTTPTGAVGGTTTGQVYSPNWLTSAIGDVSTGMGMYRTGQQAGWWGSPITTGGDNTGSPLGTNSYEDIWKKPKAPQKATTNF